MPLDPVFQRRLIDLASTAKGEGPELDFKSKWSPCGAGAKHAWTEIVRDLVGMANTDGGILVFGCDSVGKPLATKLRDIKRVDQAEIVNKIFSYTRENVGEIYVVEVVRNGVPRTAWIIVRSKRLIVFQRDAEEDSNRPSRRRQPFRRGQVFVRHGSKTETADAADLDARINLRAKELIQALRGSQNWQAAGVDNPAISPGGATATPPLEQKGVEVSTASRTVAVSKVPI